jgi:SAM-dependent methyltransferase
MAEARFDQFSRDYRGRVSRDVRVFGEAYEYFAEMKIRALRSFLDAARPSWHPAATLTVLEIGCGTGGVQPYLHLLGGRVESYAFDASLESLLEAERERRLPVRYFNADASRIPVRAGTFDLVILAVVIHHVPPGIRLSAFREVFRVLKHGGVVAVFEHNPWNPLTQWVVQHSDLDRDAILVSLPRLASQFRQAGFRIERRRFTTFFPKALSALRPLEPGLGWLPLGGQYFLAGVKPG